MTSEPAPLGLASRSWPDVAQGSTVLVPVGSLEQHGPHLPLDTDTVIATAAAYRVGAVMAASGSEVVVAPAFAYGASGEHQSFAGTVSIGHDALAVVLTELIRSLGTWAARIVLVNGHGGNIATLRATVEQMRYEQHDVSWVACAFESAVDAHAGHDETSVMLHLDPTRVRMERAEPGNAKPLENLMPVVIEAGVGAVSPSGVLGDPTTASADRGAHLFSALVMDLLGAVLRGSVDTHGRLRSGHVVDAL